MDINTCFTDPDHSPHPSFSDLLIYLLGGLGLFVLASAAIGSIYQEINNIVMVLAIISNLVFIGGSVILFGIARKRISWAGLGISPPIWRWEYLPAAFALAIGIIPLRVCAGMAIQVWVEGGLDSLQARNDLFFSGGLSWMNFIIMLVGIGILGPISEELYFRGLLYHWFKQRWGIPIGVILSSFLFGLAHIDSIAVAVSALIMGAVLALAYERTRSLYMPIAIHMITNSFAVLLTYGIMLFQEYFPQLFA